MNRLAVLNTVVKYGLVVYLVSHGVSLPADSQLEPWELAAALYHGSFGWLRAGAKWVLAVGEFLSREA